MKRTDTKSSNAPPSIPDGWYPINPVQAPQQAKKASGTLRHDELGLAKAVHPVNMKVPRLLQNNIEDERTSVRSSPRHRKLQRQLQSQKRPEIEPSLPTYAAADAFAPNKSLRLARLQPMEVSSDNTSVISPRKSPVSPQKTRSKGSKRPTVTSLSSSFTRAARFREQAPPLMPLHEAVRSFDDAVDASPLAESNQVAITELFLSDWMERFERDRSLYKSIVLHAEVAFRELYRLTANLAFPNDLVTGFACKIFDELTEHFGPFSTIMRVLSSELRHAIYAPPQPPQSHDELPYFAIVKHQKRILLSLRKDQLRRQDRNDFLRFEIDKVHDTFRQFLDRCALGLVRTIFREWYSIAVVSKRNSRKYVEYFSAWFGGSAKALVPQVFLAWKHLAVETKVARLHEQLGKHHEKLAALQKQIEELTVQRDLAQLESLAIRNDRKHAEDSIQRLHRKIQSASVYLEGSQRREAIVVQEGQLRVEAVTFLPPLVLESLLRGFHSVGFLQPLHSEFIPVAFSSGKQTDQTTSGQPRRSPPLPAASFTPSVLKQCVSTLINGTAGNQSGTNESDANQDARRKSASQDLSLDDFTRLLRGVKRRIENDSTAHLLFVSKADRGEDEEHDEEHDDDEAETISTPAHRFFVLIRQFSAVLRNVRHQDEHYARHAKLFSSRMLEHNEISVTPHALKLSSSSRPALTGDQFATPHTQSVTRVSFSSNDVSEVLTVVDQDPQSLSEADDDAAPCVYTSVDQLPLLRPQDLELTPRHVRAVMMLALAQIVSEYGSLLFSPADMTAFVRNRVIQKVMLRGIAGGKHALQTIEAALHHSTGAGGHNDSSSSDDDENGESSTGTAHRDRRGGKMIEHPIGKLRKQGERRHMLTMAPRRMSSYRGQHAPIAKDIDRGLSHLVTAYDTWNKLSQQLVEAEIVQARSTMSLPEAAVATASTESTSSLALSTGAATAALGTGRTSSDRVSISLVSRPRLQMHIEPLPGGALMLAAKERDRSEAPTTPNGTHRRSMAILSTGDWSFQTAKIRSLSLDDTLRLSHAMQSLHDMVKATTQQRAGDFHQAKHTVKSIRLMQWKQASDLASQFTVVEPASSLSATASSMASHDNSAHTGMTLLDDDRPHVFECVTFDNNAIERLFSVEDQPHDELHRVFQILERKKHIVRHAFYTKHRVGMSHATTLEDLWHVVKVLRLPRDVRVLPTMRDEELVGSGSYFNEQLFSPDDLAEVLLQLCNEQFLPQMTPLSARVDFFVTHHLPFAMQNQSAMREIMHKLDVKKALSDHGQTLRTIFRRYCAKEKDLLAAAAAKRRAAIVAAAAASAGSSSSPSFPPPVVSTTASPALSTGSATTSPAVVSHVPQGITKFMRLSDWHDFIADYKLLRARFTAEYATTVFRNVQEAEFGLEDHLEMIYSEFCEAIVALAVCFFPDPFLKHATRVHQFIRRYLPVSPEDTRDHHA